MYDCVKATSVKNPVIEYIVDNKDSFTLLGILSLQETVGFRRETTTLVEDIESGIRGTSPAPPSQHPTSTTTPNNEDSTPHRTDLLKTIDVARIYSDKTDEEEWPALPEIKYAPISPSLLNSTSSSFLSSHSYFLWSYFLSSYFLKSSFSSYILGDGDELQCFLLELPLVSLLLPLVLLCKFNLSQKSLFQTFDPFSCFVLSSLE